LCIVNYLEWALLAQSTKPEMSCSTGLYWRSRRKLITPTLHFDVLLNYVPTIAKQTRILVEQFAHFAESGDEFNCAPYFKRFALDIICGSLSIRVAVHSAPRCS